nr:MAG TPA: hypothetical protein [Caudoviricetes sp.]
MLMNTNFLTQRYYFPIITAGVIYVTVLLLSNYSIIIAFI